MGGPPGPQGPQSDPGQAHMQQLRTTWDRLGAALAGSEGHWENGGTVGDLEGLREERIWLQL